MRIIIIMEDRMHLQLESRLGDAHPSLRIRAADSGRVLLELERARLQALLERGALTPVELDACHESDRQIMALVDRLGCWRDFVRGCLDDPAAAN
ncbi:hypothetical protein [Thiohalophilus sp.]|uniref:hypothetical protein n=1 Tax=Thiohalophilus sp. TaxID=3028392 RepID=UPI002ACD5A75|nr:hypothetical protein [Thiohalophilus sp.]MDZ7802913.1 hypothetical protein [Thiohalophilus sp.]